MIGEQELEELVFAMQEQKEHREKIELMETCLLGLDVVFILKS